MWSVLKFRHWICLILTIDVTIGSGTDIFDSLFYMIPPQGKISVCDIENNGTSIVTIIDQPALLKFEDQIPAMIEGYIILSEPINACTRVKKPPPLANTILNEDKAKHRRREVKESKQMNWILLANKLNCSYRTKIDVADAAGYDGIIIFNTGSNKTEVIGLEDEKANRPFDLIIPAFFIGEYDGQILSQIFDSANNGTKRFFIKIETNPPEYKDLVYYLLWGFFGLFLFIIALCAAKPVYECVLQPWIRKHYRDRRKSLLTEAVLALALIEWKENLRDKFQTCVICMELYTDRELVRILPCNHGFHMQCIDSWLLKVRRVCPICKDKLIYSSCWEDFSDSDISDGNYFTDFAFEPSPTRRHTTRTRDNIRANRVAELGGQRVAVIRNTSEVSLNSNSSSSSTSFLSMSSFDSTRSSVEFPKIPGQVIGSASFGFCTASVHQPDSSGSGSSNSPQNDGNPCNDALEKL